MKPPHAPTVSDVLSPIEHTVLGLSRRDPVSSLRRARRRCIAALVLGPDHGAQPLANPKLEALRRYAILGRRGRLEGKAAADERGRLLACGFPEATINEIDRLVSPGRRAGRVPAVRSESSPALARALSAAIAARQAATWFAPTLGLALVAPVACYPGTANAQAGPPTDLPVEPGQPDGPPPGGPGGDHFALGVGAIYQPAYHGSDKYRFQPLPAVDIKWGRLFVNFQDGVGANLIDSESITIGAGVVMADNYRAKDVPVGIGKLSFGAGARTFVKVRQYGFEAVLGGTKVFTGSTGGVVADASLSYPIMVSQKFMLAPSIATTWGDEKHLNRYFGVSARQALASGLPRYRLGSGLMNARAEVAAQFRLTDRIGIGAVGGMSTLLGDAKDSPIVKKQTRPYGIFFVSYGF